MATLGEVKAEIASDLDRPDLALEIDRAVKRAIDYHAAERFWFNESRGTIVEANAGDNEPSLLGLTGIAEFIKIDWVKRETGGLMGFLEAVPPFEIEVLNLTTSSGTPFWYAPYENRLRLYPTPDVKTTLRVAGHVKLSPLTVDGAQNAWTNDALELILAAAKKRIYARVTKSPEQAAVAEEDENRELDRLRRETTRRTATGRIRPSW